MAIAAPSVWARGTEIPQNEAEALARWAAAPAVEWEQEDDLETEDRTGSLGSSLALELHWPCRHVRLQVFRKELDNEADMHGVR